MSQPKVCVSLLNWNSPDLTIQSIHALFELQYPNIEIIVIDNGSVDDSVSRIRAEFPEICLIETKENLGYAGGHRKTMELALKNQADLIWLLNVDIQLHPNTLNELVETAQALGYENLYGSVPLEAFPTNGARDQLVLRPKKYFAVPYKEVIFPRQPFTTYGNLFPHHEPREVGALAGASWIIPVKVVQKHGFLDEQFFMYAEVVDYCLRLRKRGVASILVPRSMIIHHQQGTYTHNRPLRDLISYYKIRNQILLIRRHQSLWVLTKAVLKDSLLLVRNVVLSPRKMALRNRYIFRGILDGLRNRKGKTYPPEAMLTESSTE